MKQTFKSASVGRPAGFTLIELLVVISIIGILAGFTIVGLGAVKRQQAIKTATGEMQQISGALEQFKAKYGFYPKSNINPYQNPLYYELHGVTRSVNGIVTYYTLLDGSSTIKEADFITGFNVGGVVNCTRGSGEDVASAKDFLAGSPKPLKITTTQPTGSFYVTNLVSSVRGPDDDYRPFGSTVLDANPFRYICPGTNNPNSYDLWIQLKIGGKTNLICNWKSGVEINSTMP
jgi:prepilin-type N-terminal cleavage/methylation domain-containing protein